MFGETSVDRLPLELHRVRRGVQATILLRQLQGRNSPLTFSGHLRAARNTAQMAPRDCECKQLYFSPACQAARAPRSAASRSAAMFAA
jgi:hypothetical protein